MFSLRMRTHVYLAASVKNPDISIQFLDPHSRISSEISAISGCFPLIFFIEKAESLPHFYFRFILPTALEVRKRTT